MERLSDKLSLVSSLVKESVRLKSTLVENENVILSIAEKITTALRMGNKILICGNGGSAADAQHIAAELAGKFNFERRPLPAIALTTNTSILTSIANDYTYEDVFSRQVQALVKPGDVVIGISTSGNSPNVVKAINEANSIGAFTVAFTGKGGKLKEIAEFCLAVPSDDTPRIQEVHITAGHIICHIVEESLFGKASFEVE